MDNEETKEQTSQEQDIEKVKPNVNTGLISLEIAARMNQVDINMQSVVREYGIETADTPPEELAELREHLAELTDEDRQFLLDCFDSQIGCVAAGEAIGLTKNQAHYKKVKLLEELSEKMK